MAELLGALLFLKKCKWSDQAKLTNRKNHHFWQLRHFQLSKKAQASKLLTVDVLIVLKYLFVIVLCNY
jgi:hypothetical protein